MSERITTHDIINALANAGVLSTLDDPHTGHRHHTHALTGRPWMAPTPQDTPGPARPAAAG